MCIRTATIVPAISDDGIICIKLISNKSVYQLHTLFIAVNLSILTNFNKIHRYTRYTFIYNYLFYTNFEYFLIIIQIIMTGCLLELID